MWLQKYEIVSIASDPSAKVAQITLRYSDDKGQIKEMTERISDKSKIDEIARNAINELNRIDTIDALIASPELKLVDLTPSLPTPQQVDLQNYNSKRANLIQAKQDLELGLITQAEFSTLLAEVKSLKK